MTSLCGSLHVRAWARESFWKAFGHAQKSQNAPSVHMTLAALFRIWCFAVLQLKALSVYVQFW
jgi:hypothetical protein